MSAAIEETLPPGWAWATLGELAEIVGGSTPPSTDPSCFQPDGIPWITPSDLSGYLETYVERGARSLSKHGLASCSAKMLPAGTVLLSSRAPIGYCVIASVPLSTNQGFKSFVLTPCLHAEYLRFFLLHSRDFLESIASGTTFKELSGGRVATVVVPLPPLAEQRRIVAALDETLGRVRAARASLDEAPALLERARQAVLAAAFRGELTEAWRAEHPEVEAADVLLERIRAERRRRWEEAELAKLTAKGKAPTDDRWKAKYEEPCTPRSIDDLPASWGTTNIDTCVYAIGAGSSFRCDERPPGRDEVGVVKVSAISWGVYDDAESKTCVDPLRVDAQLFIERGDFLVSRANTIELVGACVIAERVERRVMLSDKVLRLRFAMPNEGFVLYALRSSHCRREIERLSTGAQESMRNIGQDRLRAVTLPLPPLAEQHEIVRRVDAALAKLDAVAAAVEETRAQLDAIERAVLAKAFRGELVAQDAADEPAAEMLARLRESRAATPTKRGRRAAKA